MYAFGFNGFDQLCTSSHPYACEMMTLPVKLDITEHRLSNHDYYQQPVTSSKKLVDDEPASKKTRLLNTSHGDHFQFDNHSLNDIAIAWDRVYCTG